MGDRRSIELLATAASYDSNVIDPDVLNLIYFVNGNPTRALERQASLEYGRSQALQKDDPDRLLHLQNARNLTILAAKSNHLHASTYADLIELYRQDIAESEKALRR